MRTVDIIDLNKGFDKTQKVEFPDKRGANKQLFDKIFKEAMKKVRVTRGQRESEE